MAAPYDSNFASELLKPGQHAEADHVNVAANPHHTSSVPTSGPPSATLSTQQSKAVHKSASTIQDRIEEVLPHKHRDLTTQSNLLFPSRAEVIQAIKEVSLPFGAGGAAPTPTEHNQVQQKSPPLEQFTLPTTVDAVDAHIAVEPSLGWLRRIFPNDAIRMMAQSFATLLPTGYLGVGPPEKPPDVPNNKKPIQVQSFDDTHPLPNEKPKAAFQSFTETQHLLHPQMCGMIESDRRSIWSEDSEDDYKYEVWVHVRDKDGRIWKLCVLVDTQSPKSFISRGTLSRIGSFTERRILEAKKDAYTGPFGDKETIPQWYIDVGLEFQGIELQDSSARLRIMEETNRFQIILGRDFITRYGKKTKTSLLGILEESTVERPVSETAPNVVGALRSEKRTKKHEAMDEELRVQTLQNFRDLYGGTPSSASVPSRVSVPIESERASSGSSAIRNNADRSSHSAKITETNRDWRLSARPSTVKTFSQQTTDPNPDDFVAEWRSQRTNTSSTQFTQYSFGRQSTASSMSSLASWDGPLGLAGKPSAAPTRNEEDSPERNEGL
ncbi:uncharacterized protein PAC_16578 [Phialocephala subalpina]|uniref:Uncharacterized protein n=1 Tax=Phialocephala subalpina TaxID=576137 RepID=A0A1L7XNZ0_9HELO|nr:uncharacterized protein PAC_16578 [Phialocephala subalpina]